MLDATTSEIETMQQTEDRSMIQILASMQERIKELEDDKLKLASELNQFRLGLFMPRKLDVLDINPIASRVTYNILTILKEDGLEAAQTHRKLQLEIITRTTDLIDEYKSKESIKIRLDEDDKEKKAKVEKIRKETSPEAKKERVLLTNAEKAVNLIRKNYKGLTVNQLIPFVAAFRKDMSEDEIKSHLESIFAKEAAAKLKSK